MKEQLSPTLTPASTVALHVPGKAKLLVCVNNNNHSKVALRFACHKAKNTGCPVELLTIIEPSDYQTFNTIADKMRKEQQDTAEKLLHEFAGLAQETAGITPSLMVREGLIGEQIIEAIEEDSHINMVILGTSPDSPGRGSILPFLASQLGSKLLIPMLIVPGNLTEQQIKELT